MKQRRLRMAITVLALAVVAIVLRQDLAGWARQRGDARLRSGECDLHWRSRQ